MRFFRSYGLGDFHCETRDRRYVVRARCHRCQGLNKGWKPLRTRHTTMIDHLMRIVHRAHRDRREGRAEEADKLFEQVSRWNHLMEK
jgi:hypothetical protein